MSKKKSHQVLSDDRSRYIMPFTATSWAIFITDELYLDFRRLSDKKNNKCIHVMKTKRNFMHSIYIDRFLQYILSSDKYRVAVMQKNETILYNDQMKPVARKYTSHSLAVPLRDFVLLIYSQ